MLTPSPKPQSLTLPSSHPRRPPAHLSVSLRHRSPVTGNNSTLARQPYKGTEGPEFPASRQLSDHSDNSEDSTGPGLQQWFDRSNRCPEMGFTQTREDNDPPYFLPRDSSSNSNAPSKSRLKFLPGRLGPNLLHADTSGSSADDFRSVIDDLTIENKKLKERLRKYEKRQNAHLEKDRLFEVKIHSLPARKRRELEDVLREFAASIDNSTDEGDSRIQTKEILPYPSLNPGMTSLAKHPSSNSTSKSRPVDSAYASMSHSNSNSTPALNTALEGFGSHQPLGKEQNVQSFLHNIPEGLLPKQPPVMTERQKKKIVVQRLEQLFTGYKGVNIGIHSQPLQQQEVSNSAAKADQKADHDPMALEGIREAHILPYVMESDNVRPAKLSADSGNEMQISGSSDESSPCRSPEQRPTRPLDLDPDRAQIPADNVEYIRHLGLSTPHFESEGSAETETDARGWIYLNLLINMAQLHIINVTPDFVRAAVADVSEKFQLSRDGKRVRWRGGTQGTHLSSDSGASSALHRSPHHGEEMDDGRRKRRKLETGKSTSAPFKQNSLSRGIPGQFHYKPLFLRQDSSSNGLLSSDESDSLLEYEGPNASGRISRPAKFRSRSGSKGPRNDEGPIVFYSGAKFCTDLSGDRGDRGSIITSIHFTGVGKDGYSDFTETALGCRSESLAPPFFRTTSGSLLSSRPFKNYSRGPAFLDTDRPKTPELLKDDQNNDFGFEVQDSPASSGPPKPLQKFEASGLGGTQPADHFAVRVQTRVTRLRRSAVKISRFSTPSPKLGRFGRIISKSSLDAFHSEALEDLITSRLDSLMSLSRTPAQKPTSRDLPVKTEVVFAQFEGLEPSELPPPAGYYATTSSSEDGYEPSSSSAGVSHLGHGRAFMPKSFASYIDMDGISDERGGMDEDEDEEMEADDSSIDMLAQATALDSRGVSAKEQEFEMNVELDVVPARSSAATVDYSDGTETSGNGDS